LLDSLLQEILKPGSQPAGSSTKIFNQKKHATI